jgi:hypothetical protein
MAYDKNKVQKFDKINKSKLTLNEPQNRTRTGAWKTKNRIKAHGKHSKH